MSANSKGYNTNLASEFYILSMLYRKGFDAHLTMGSKKSIDIIIKNKENKIVTIDVKGIRGMSIFPLDNLNLEENNPFHFIIFVSFHNRIYDEFSLPESYIVPLNEINDILYTNPKKNRKGVKLSSLRSNRMIFQNNWEILKGYGSGYKENILIDKKKWFEFLILFNGLKEEFLSFDYYSRSLSLIEFLEIQDKVSSDYPLDLNKLYSNYSEYLHLHDIIRLKKQISNLTTISNNKRHEECLEKIINERYKKGEKDIDAEDLIISIDKPPTRNLIDYIARTSSLHKKKKRIETEKLKSGL